MDELDIKILKLLRNDGRLSYREMAKTLGVATGTIQNRIQKLEKEGVILGYHAQLDYSKLGYTITALIAMVIRREDPEGVKEAEQMLTNHPNVFGLYTLTGEFDLLISTKFRTMTELDDFIKKELSSTAIKKTVTFLALKTIKEKHTLLE
jgi:Lrp/AsnC family transcriptional regulator for asnA, asnC and gidA